MIRQDKATKEIAEFLNISDSAVIFHRNNLRKKIGLVNKKVSLKSYLQTLS
jgi:DNA-binding CsgD family transcriptional regulator